ncbi:MAG: hypothetical protein LBL54_05375, partial [Clostridiales Family XIII bacterium]|nr:hypothetical protein [Clostridiales Family XIII bacterium]
MSTIKERYFDILTNGANLVELCDLTAEYVKNPVALELATHTIIAKSHDYSHYLLDEFTAGHEKATEEELKEISDRMEELLHEGKAIKRIWPYLKHKHVNCGCFHRNNLIAVIDCPIVGDFDESSLSVIEMASSIFVIALGLNSYITLNFIYPMQNYLIGLLKNEIDEQYQQHNYYGLILETVKSFRIIWAKPESKDRTTPMRNMVTTFCKRQTNW